jgi:TusA-related sulfurtransferase
MAREVRLPGGSATPLAQSVDCRGAQCPRPQLLTIKMLKQMNEGEVLEVRCDSAPAVEGFPALAMKLSSTHLGTLRDPDGWRVYLRKGL